jgi:hypothetical protein
MDWSADGGSKTAGYDRRVRLAVNYALNRREINELPAWVSARQRA